MKTYVTAKKNKIENCLIENKKWYNSGRKSQNPKDEGKIKSFSKTERVKIEKITRRSTRKE